MKMKTSELKDRALDWAVAMCEVGAEFIGDIDDPHFYSTDWAQGGMIIEREVIHINAHGTTYEPWIASMSNGEWSQGWVTESITALGATPLIAAMRCYVTSKLGDTIDVPDGLPQG